MGSVTEDGEELAIGLDLGKKRFHFGGADAGVVRHPVIADEMRVTVDDGVSAMPGIG